VSNDIPEVQDHSRVDAFAAARRRAMVLHAVWRPMLAGAAGAALVIGAVWVATPKIHYTDIEIPRVTMRDVTVPNIITKDVEIDIPRIIAPPPIATNPPAPRADAPKTADEKRFTETPEYKGAIYRGRIIKSVDGQGIYFADGQSFRPAHWDEATSQTVYDSDEAFETDALVGDMAMCVQDAHRLWQCTALLPNGQEVTVGLKQKSANVSPPASAPSPPITRYSI
jgi:hypothetical protein